MTPSKRPHLPIGYWLKKVDGLLTEQIDALQAKNGVSRLEWQTLNALFEAGEASSEDLLSVLETFTDEDTLKTILQRFTDDLGWVASESAEKTRRYRLTDEGLLRHSAILTAQQKARQLAMQHVSEEDYATVLRVLQQISTNLEGEALT